MKHAIKTHNELYIFSMLALANNKNKEQVQEVRKKIMQEAIAKIHQDRNRRTQFAIEQQTVQS